MPGNISAVTPKLSICIATYNRGAFIGQTLDSIMEQIGPEVELLVVDGASPDDTASVVERYLAPDRPLRYLREAVNSGVDGDYDKAVGYASGEYCWLMTDDDLLAPGAVARVVAALESGPDLVIANAQVCTVDFSTVLTDRFLPFDNDRKYGGGTDAFFADVASYLSFIGGVVVKRSLWLSRERQAFYGTVFIHVGVLFQAPLVGEIKVIAEPLVRIRYGNSMWTPRAFEIWMLKWPALIWGFAGYSDAAKAKVTAREPWRSFRKLMFRRAVGGYSIVEYRQFLAGNCSRGAAWQAWLVARMPGSFANVVAGFYCLVINRDAKAGALDLARSKHSTWISRQAARTLAGS